MFEFKCSASTALPFVKERDLKERKKQPERDEGEKGGALVSHIRPLRIQIILAATHARTHCALPTQKREREGKERETDRDGGRRGKRHYH